MAVELHSDIKGKLLTEIIAPVDELMSTAFAKAGDLSDNDYNNRELKQSLLRAVFLNKNAGDPSSEAEELLSSLDNKYYRDFKKHLLTKFILERNGYISVSRIEDITQGVGDEAFRKRVHSENMRHAPTDNDAGRMYNEDTTTSWGGPVG